MEDSKPTTSPAAEKKGKSWKREREEIRGRRPHLADKKTKPDATSVQSEEQKKAEEEQKRIDEEEKAKEQAAEEQRAKEEEERQKKEDDKKLLMDYVTEAQTRFKERKELRQKNQHITRPEESHFSSLDSSLKKNTAFVRKLKNFTATQEAGLAKDMRSLNLSKYISEVAAALVEAKLKMTDVAAAVSLSSQLHQNYADFAPHFLENWQKALGIKKDDKIQNASKLRVDLRFYAELVTAGVFSPKEGLPLLGQVLTALTAGDKEEHNNLNIMLSFCKHCGDDYAGLVSRKMRILAEQNEVALPQSGLLPPEKQKNVRQLFKDYCTSLCKHLVKEHKEVQQFEFQNRKILQTRGELSAERKDKMEAMLAAYKKLYDGTQSFCDILDEDMPELPTEEMLRSEELALKTSTLEGEEGITNSNLWEDDETRYFYESLPDLKAFVPSILYKDSAQATIPQEADEVLESKLDEEIEDLDEGKKEEETPPPPDIEEVEETEQPVAASNKILLDAFLTHVMNCVSREMIDNAASEFVLSLNTKLNRKKLVKALFGVQRTRIDLLPFLARLVATLHPCMPDVAADLAHMLKQDFKYHVRKKDQINIESKIKVVRFIGELVKFRMYSRVEALFCLKLLLHDFTHHHIEMVCNLLEVCGRYLLRSPESHQRTKVYLEQMMRKKSVMALDSRYVTMIDNAYYWVDPPEVSPSQMRKERPPMHEYIRKLLYFDLSKPTTDKILRQMRKLDWKDPEILAYAVKCLTNVWNVKYLNIGCVASLLAGLVAYQESVGSQVVDGVLEDIRLGMEINHPKYNQRRVAMVKYIGELYNYRMIESGDVFKVLYSLITFGVSQDRAAPSPLDPPEHLFRIRLACTLLDTCGQYFSGGTSKKKLDCFFVYFQLYYWFKRTDPQWSEDNQNPFPLGIEFMYRDTVTTLRPRLQLCTSLEEAERGVATLQEELIALLPQETESMKEHDGGLEPITEQEVEEDEEEEEDSRPRSSKVTLHTIAEHEEVDEDMDIGDLGSDSEQQALPRSYENYSQSQGEEMALTGEEVEWPPEAPHITRPETCPEDQDFMEAFDKMVSDNIQERLKDSVKPRTDIVVPMKSFSTKKVYEQLVQPEQQQETVNFVLLVRKGNKQQYKNLSVAVDSELALNLKNQEEAERLEKERVKRLTLDINERLEEEDYQEMLAQAQRPAMVTLNHERRPKYQHPKGAPDADLIFGSKK